MKLSTISNALWGQKAKLSYLMLASAILLFTLLGAREIWTQEHRWADIVSGMFYRHDFFHPYLGENTYYDKPLLSYWFIVAIAKITGILNTWTLRIPSALSGLLAIWSIYRLGTKIKDRQLGLLAGWMLITTFYFLFWARTSSADMLNLGGSLFAIAWYFDRRENANFFDYAVFFLIVALTSLCKGLVGAIVPFIAVFTNIVLEKSWKQHLRPTLFLAAIPAFIIYVLPFIASTQIGGENYTENGLYLVYRENILRYFQPFDHKGPLYTYFLYLPIYMMPWALFFIPALFALPARWKTLSANAKWVAWTLLLLFLFFTCSGSRRSYYVLPIVPFALLFTADWILANGATAARRMWTAGIAMFSLVMLFLIVDVLPGWYYAEYGVDRFATALKDEASKIQPWEKWDVIMLDGEAKLNFYLQLPPQTKNYSIRTDLRAAQTTASAAIIWPMLTQKSDNTIFISRKIYVPILQAYLTDYRMVEIPTHNMLPFMKNHELNAPVAFIPNK